MKIGDKSSQKRHDAMEFVTDEAGAPENSQTTKDFTSDAPMSIVNENG